MRHHVRHRSRIRLQILGGAVSASDVSLTIVHEDFVSVLGPSGCGKTALMRRIAGLERPDSGRVLLNGEDTAAQASHSRRFWIVFQSLALFPHVNVGGHLTFGLRLKNERPSELRSRVNELLERVRIRGLADRRIRQLSGGQRQRVVIACALAQEPPVFSLDEPFIGLSNLLPLEVISRDRVRLGESTIRVKTDMSLEAGRRAKHPIRQESVRIKLGDARCDQAIPVQVISLRDRGSTVESRLDCDGHHDLNITAPRDRDGLEAGQARHLVLAPDACRVLAA